MLTRGRHMSTLHSLESKIGPLWLLQGQNCTRCLFRVLSGPEWLLEGQNCTRCLFRVLSVPEWLLEGQNRAIALYYFNLEFLVRYLTFPCQYF